MHRFSSFIVWRKKKDFFCFCSNTRLVKEAARKHKVFQITLFLTNNIENSEKYTGECFAINLEFTCKNKANLSKMKNPLKKVTYASVVENPSII